MVGPARTTDLRAPTGSPGVQRPRRRSPACLAGGTRASDTWFGTSVRVPGDPIKLSRTQRTTHRFPPRLGQDTHQVWQQALNLDLDTTNAWQADGLFGS